MLASVNHYNVLISIDWPRARCISRGSRTQCMKLRSPLHVTVMTRILTACWESRKGKEILWLPCSDGKRNAIQRQKVSVVFNIVPRIFSLFIHSMKCILPFGSQRNLSIKVQPLLQTASISHQAIAGMGLTGTVCYICNVMTLNDKEWQPCHSFSPRKSGVRPNNCFRLSEFYFGMIYMNAVTRVHLMCMLWHCCSQLLLTLWEHLFFKHFGSGSQNWMFICVFPQVKWFWAEALHKNRR